MVAYTWHYYNKVSLDKDRSLSRMVYSYKSSDANPYMIICVYNYIFIFVYLQILSIVLSCVWLKLRYLNVCLFSGTITDVCSIRYAWVV